MVNSRNREGGPRGISGREASAGWLQADGKEPQMRAEDCHGVTGPPATVPLIGSVVLWFKSTERGQ